MYANMNMTGSDAFRVRATACPAPRIPSELLRIKFTWTPLGMRLAPLGDF